MMILYGKNCFICFGRDFISQVKELFEKRKRMQIINDYNQISDKLEQQAYSRLFEGNHTLYKG